MTILEWGFIREEFPPPPKPSETTNSGSVTDILTWPKYQATPYQKSNALTECLPTLVRNLIMKITKLQNCICLHF